jgi:hypothetical protein
MMSLCGAVQAQAFLQVCQSTVCRFRRKNRQLVNMIIEAGADMAKAVANQGNRISTFEDCQQIVIIPSCLQSFGMNATFGRFFIFEQIERQMAQDG